MLLICQFTEFAYLGGRLTHKNYSNFKLYDNFNSQAPHLPYTEIGHVFRLLGATFRNISLNGEKINPLNRRNGLNKKFQILMVRK